jgi:hypothetical protein
VPFGYDASKKEDIFSKCWSVGMVNLHEYIHRQPVRQEAIKKHDIKMAQLFI